MSDQNFTPEENLSYIRDVMAKAKHKTTQAGPFLAGWGTASAFVTFLQYLASIGILELSIMPYFWAAFGVGGGIASGIYGSKIERDSGPASLNEITTNMLFSCIGITLGLFFVGNIIGIAMGFKANLNASEICTVISIVMAIAFFVSSFSTGITWFKWVAIGWWVALAIFIMNPFSESNSLLLIAVLDFVLLALPGYKLMSIAKQEMA